jgi:hypothetical protein
VWIAVLGSVKLFPNLEAALKGVFNRVLKNLRKASALPDEKLQIRVAACAREMANARVAFSPRVSHARSSCRHNLNDGTKGALRVTLRAVAKPGIAIEL